MTRPKKVQPPEHSPSAASGRATEDAHTACGDACAQGSDRRTFLRDGLLAVAALTAVAGSAAPLHALGRTLATGIVGAGDTVRYDIPSVDGATIDRANRLVLVRYQGMVHAFSLECPHKGTMITWQAKEQRFFCPKHKSTFKPEGSRIQGKAPRHLDRFAVRLDAGQVIVDTATLIDAEKDAPAWNLAGVKVG